MKMHIYDEMNGSNDSFDLGVSGKNIVHNHPVIQQFVLMCQSNKRMVGAHTQTRGEVKVSGRKLYRQKGTGNARVGDAGSPIRKGGGVAFGPSNKKNYLKKMPKNMRRLALSSIFFTKVASEDVAGVKFATRDTPSTKRLSAVLSNIGIKKSVLLISTNDDIYLNKSAKNLSGVTSKDYRYVSAMDIVSNQSLIITNSSLEPFIARFH